MQLISKVETGVERKKKFITFKIKATVTWDFDNFKKSDKRVYIKLPGGECFVKEIIRLMDPTVAHDSNVFV